MITIVRLSSITKKIFVALLGSFLLLFVLFHMCANLCVLRNDGGMWYSDFCHFMGTNYIVKIFEVVLLGVFGLHILLTLWLWFCNRKSRPVGYHQPSATKTAKGSKYMVITGVLMILCLGLHFYDFFLVKFGVKNEVSQYMVKVEELNTTEAMQLVSLSGQNGMSPEDFVKLYKEEAANMKAELPVEQQRIVDEQVEKLERNLAVIQLLSSSPDRVSEDGKWVKKVSADERKVIEEAVENVKFEPDFYNMARDLFHKPVISILYLFFFAVLGFHLRHAFESVFQTFGLNNYKYSRVIEITGLVFAWMICIGFALVPIGVMFLC